MIDRRSIEQIKREVAEAAACLDDARSAVADLADTKLSPLDAEDFRTTRLFINQALMKVRGANAALARLEDRAKRECLR